MDLVPGLVGEGHVAGVADGLVAADRLVDQHERPVGVAMPVADQHAADFQGELLRGMGGDPLVDLAVEEDAEVLLAAGGKGSLAQVSLRELGNIQGFVFSAISAVDRSVSVGWPTAIRRTAARSPANS